MTRSDRSLVQLISKPSSRSTGIGRYAYELEIGLRGRDIEVITAALGSPVPKPIARMLRKVGLDSDAFSRSYPIRAHAKKGYLTHLTSQTLATLLMTQRLPRPVIVTVH